MESTTSIRIGVCFLKLHSSPPLPVLFVASICLSAGQDLQAVTFAYVTDRRLVAVLSDIVLKSTNVRPALLQAVVVINLRNQSGMI